MENSTRNTVPLRTLALDPGAREMGYAVLERNDLLYFGIHTFKGRHSLEEFVAEARSLLDRLIESFDPQIFAIEQTRFKRSRRPRRVHEIVEALRAYAETRGLVTLAYTPTSVKLALAGDGNATKRQVAAILATQWYPFLDKYFRRDLRSQEQYWQNMFDAVALGILGYEDVSKRRLAAKAAA
jgi:crossover junction endodeoxyribonuclease RuvC